MGVERTNSFEASSSAVGGALPRPPLGLALDGLVALATVPEHAFSRIAGFCSRRRLPPAMQKRLLAYFCARFGVDASEAEKPLGDYATLHEFFIRRLRPGLRPIDPRAEVVASPVDGFVAESGEIHDGRLLQAKGRPYSLAALLADEVAAQRFRGGQFVTLYLHPRNYHRIHAPVGGEVVACHAVPGRLLPVMPAIASRVDDVFSKNERVVVMMETTHGPVAVVLVGAAGVGHISVSFDDTIRTPVPRGAGGRRRPRSVSYSPGRPLAKGDELGIFHLGSTVICVFAPGQIELERFPLGAPIRVGEALARRAAGTRERES